MCRHRRPTRGAASRARQNGRDVVVELGDPAAQLAQPVDGREGEPDADGVAVTSAPDKTCRGVQGSAAAEGAGAIPVAGCDGQQDGVQPVADPSSLSDKLIASVDQELEVGVEALRLSTPHPAPTSSPSCDSSPATTSPLLAGLRHPLTGLRNSRTRTLAADPSSSVARPNESDPLRRE